MAALLIALLRQNLRRAEILSYGSPTMLGNEMMRGLMAKLAYLLLKIFKKEAAGLRK